MMSVDVLTTRSDLSTLADEWQELADHAACTVYQTPGWNAACSMFLPDGASPRIVAVREGQRLAGLAPCYVVSRFGVRHLRLLTATVLSRQQMILARSGEERAVADTLAEFLISDDGWDVLDIRDAPQWAAATHALHAALGTRGCEVRTSAERQHRVIALPATFNEFLASLQAGFRRELNRAARRLREAGAAERTVTDAGERAALLGTLFAQHRHRFAEIGRQSAATPRWTAFYGTVLEHLGDRAVLSALDVPPGGAPVALDFSLVHSGHWHDRVASIDHASPLRRFSPGNVLKLYVIRQAIERGCGEFDMSFGHEAYKVRLGAVPRSLVSIHVVAPRRRSRVASAAWRLGQRLVTTSRNREH